MKKEYMRTENKRAQLLTRNRIIGIIIIFILAAFWDVYNTAITEIATPIITPPIHSILTLAHLTTSTTSTTTLSTTTTIIQKPYMAIVVNKQNIFPQNYTVFITNQGNASADSFAFYLKTKNISDMNVSTGQGNINITYPYGKYGTNVYAVAHRIGVGDVGRINVTLDRPSDIIVNVNNQNVDYCSSTFSSISNKKFLQYNPNGIANETVSLSVVGNCSSFILSKLPLVTFPVIVKGQNQSS